MKRFERISHFPSWSSACEVPLRTGSGEPLWIILHDARVVSWNCQVAAKACPSRWQPRERQTR